MKERERECEGGWSEETCVVAGWSTYCTSCFPSGIHESPEVPLAGGLSSAHFRLRFCARERLEGLSQLQSELD